MCCFSASTASKSGSGTLDLAQTRICIASQKRFVIRFAPAAAQIIHPNTKLRVLQRATECRKTPPVSISSPEDMKTLQYQMRKKCQMSEILLEPFPTSVHFFKRKTANISSAS
jgi:hypothetical protein